MTRAGAVEGINGSGRGRGRGGPPPRPHFPLLLFQMQRATQGNKERVVTDNWQPLVTAELTTTP